MKDLNVSRAAKLTLKIGEAKKVEPFGMTLSNTNIVYEHDEVQQNTIGYFQVNTGKNMTTVVLSLGGQKSLEGFLFNFVGEHAGTADIEVIQIEKNKVFALRRNNEFTLLNVNFYLWSITKEKNKGFIVYFKLKEKDKEEVIALLKYPDEANSVYLINSMQLTLIKVENKEFAHLIIEDI